jgi:hypothetical protein
MIAELQTLSESGSWEVMRIGLARFLGVAGPVPDQVLRRAIADDHFAHYLIVCRGEPTTLEMLLRDPKNEAYSVTGGAGVGMASGAATEQALRPAVVAAPRAPASSIGLVAKAAGSFARWAAAGFTQVDRAEFDRRYGICLACSHLTTPPDLAAYRLAPDVGDDRRICDACGCFATAKARRTNERCPVADPARPGLNRWGQAIGPNPD